ncbi:MAG: methyltransferase domain-containing protein, partial [Patescibacteria group bacterium]|nr:methyltransferase domain-containing protein [Patescibacteria group bacterium]
MVKRITRCRICLGSVLRPFFDLGRQPFSHTLYKAIPHREHRYPLALVWCKRCALVQLNHTAEPEELFSHYRWVTGTSRLAQNFALLFADELTKRTIGAQGGFVLEVASNDGTFLRPFVKRGERVLGIDPARNIVRAATAAGIASMAGFFGARTAARVLRKHGPADMVIARNVVPHVADPHDFVAGLARVLAPEGTLAIEIQYAPIVLEELHYDTIYHQHLCYFTLHTLERLLSEHGLYIFDLIQSPISGGAIVVYARKTRVRAKAVVARYRSRERALQANTFRAWQRFARR